MQQLLNRLLNAFVGFLLAAWKSDDPNRPLPTPPPFPVGTPPTPPPIPPLPPNPDIPGQPGASEVLRWNHAVRVFVDKWNGKFVPPKFGGDFQCVALVNEFTIETWGVYWPRLSFAGDFVGYAIKRFRFIPNTPTNYPWPGDIVEWHRSPNLPGGHIAVVESATPMQLTSFDQNWPQHSPAHPQGHTYAGVSGWHHFIG